MRLLLLLVFLGWMVPDARAVDVVVVQSDRTPGYLETTDVLLANVQGQNSKAPDVQVVSVKEFQSLDLTAKPAPRVLVALGTEALRAVLLRDSATPVLAGLITRFGFERLVRESPQRGVASVAALYLDQPLGRQLNALRQALPAAKRVGVVLGPESSHMQERLANLARQQGLELSIGIHNAATPLVAALRGALVDADVLFAIADTQVYNSATVANILLTAYRVRVPVLAFSPAYVRAGALMSVHSTSAHIGAQLALIVRPVLQGGAFASGGYYPSDFSVAINTNVARSLGLDLDAAKIEAAVRQGERQP